MCFIGAHYFSIIKLQQFVNYRAKLQWTLFDDDKPITIFENWENILNFLLSCKSMPTLLVYEQVNENNYEMRDDAIKQADL